MAMSSVIRIASSTVFPHPIRAIASSSILSGSITNTFISHNFSTDAKKLIDSKLIKVLDSEIRSATLLDFDKRRPPTPPHFPFTIKDTLSSAKDSHFKREFAGEKITVSIMRPPSIPIVDDGEDVSDDVINDGSGGPQPDLVLDLAISKSSADSDEESADNEELTKLQFRVSVSADNITVLAMKYEELSETCNKFHAFGPYLVDPAGVEIDLQRALRRYIEVRGVTVSNAEFMYKYKVWIAKRDRMLAPEAE